MTRVAGLRRLLPLLVTGLALVFFAGNALAMPRIQQLTSPAGITVWLVREPAIPLLAMRAWFPGGSAADPADRSGLSLMATSLLDEGAGEYDSEAFQARLQDLSIRLSFSSDRDGISVSLTTLSEHKAEAFRLAGLALAAPRFDAEPVERVRQQILVAQKRRADTPNTVAVEAWEATAWPDHPFGRSDYGTPETVAAITVAEMKALAASRFDRTGLLVALVGDVGVEEAGALVDAAFARLPAKAAPAATPAVGIQPGLKVIERDFPQSVVLFGLPGLHREDPDWYAASVLNYVLGGSTFTSRLMREIREKRGLAYSVDTWLVPWPASPALQGYVATENASVATSIELVRSEIGRLVRDGITDEELADAQTYMTGSFPLSLSSNAEIAAVLLQMRRFDLPPEHLERRSALIEAVSRADVARVAARMLDPARMLTVVVGRPEGLAPEGAAEGRVTDMPVAAPGDASMDANESR